MGKGNVCVSGKYEGLFYIDNDHLNVYRYFDPDDPYGECEPETRLQGDITLDQMRSDDWVYDEEGSMCEQDDVEAAFIASFTEMFPSFTRDVTREWLDGYDRRVILENGLFFICVEDNEWSEAVELIQKEAPYGSPCLENLQKKHYAAYLDGMKKALLQRLPEIHVRTGPWTSQAIKRSAVA